MSLPASLCRLGSLVELNVSNNKLEALPAEMGRLSALVTLVRSQHHTWQGPLLAHGD